MMSEEIDRIAAQLGEVLRNGKHDEDCIAFVLDRFRSLLERSHVAIEAVYPLELAEMVAKIRDQHQAAAGAQLQACIDAWIEVWRLRRQVLMLPIRCQTQ